MTGPPPTPRSELREQVARTMWEHDSEGAFTYESTRDDWLEAADAICAVLAAHIQQLRKPPPPPTPDITPGNNASQRAAWSIRDDALADVLALLQGAPDD